MTEINLIISHFMVQIALAFKLNFALLKQNSPRLTIKYCRLGIEILFIGDGSVIFPLSKKFGLP